MHQFSREEVEGGAVYNIFKEDLLGTNSQFDVIGGAYQFDDDIEIEQLLVDLTSYPKSLSSKVKHELIHRIGLAVRKLGAKVNMKSMDTILQSLKKFLPDPDSRRRTVRGDTKKLVEISKAIARVINETFGSLKGAQVIPINQEPKYLVRDVAQHIYGLSCGVNIEFYRVYGILQNLLRKLENLASLLQSFYVKNNKAIGKVVDETQNPTASIAYTEISAMSDQVMTTLKGLIEQMRAATGILATDENKIAIELDKHKKKYDTLTMHYDAYDIDTNEEAYGDNLARLLSGLENTAVLAYIVENSLKNVGMSMSQYKSFKSVGDMMDSLITKMEKIDPKRDIKKINDILTNAEALAKYFGKRKSFKGGARGGGCGSCGSSGAYSLMSEPAFSGGEEDDNVEHDVDYSGGDLEAEYAGGAMVYGGARTPEDIAADARKKRAELAIKSYVKELNLYIDKFVKNINEAATSLGTTTYDTRKLEDTIDGIQILEDLRDKSLYLAFAGYYLDDTWKLLANQYRERMLRLVKNLRDYAGKVPGARKYLVNASENVMDMLKKIDFFADLFRSLLRNVPRIDVERIVGNIPTSVYSIDTARRRLYHSLHVSQMRRMMKKTCENIGSYTERYSELLAFSIGTRRHDLEEEKNVLLACGDAVTGDDTIANAIRKKAEQESLESMFFNTIGITSTVNTVDGKDGIYIKKAAAVYKSMFDKSVDVGGGKAPAKIAMKSAVGHFLDTLKPVTPDRVLAGTADAYQNKYAWGTTALAALHMVPDVTGLDKTVRAYGNGIPGNHHLWRAKNVMVHIMNPTRSVVFKALRKKLNYKEETNNYKDVRLEKYYKDNIGEMRKEIDDEFKAKHRLYKALESLDLILSAFTQELVDDVDLIKEVKKYLDDTKVYARWFTDYTGDLLCSVFESMPAFVDQTKDDTIEGIVKGGRNDPFVGTTAANPTDARTAWHESFPGDLGAAGANATNITTGATNIYPGLAGAAARPPLNTQTAARNTFFASNTPYIRVGDSILDPDLVYDPKKVIQIGTTHDKFDPTIGNMFGTPAYSGIAEQLASLQNRSYYYRHLYQRIQNAQVHRGMYGKCTGMVDMENKYRTRRYIDKFYDNFQALKNIFHSFITLYNNIATKSGKTQAIMSPSQIYYSILSYLKQSALARKDHKAFQALRERPHT